MNTLFVSPESTAWNDADNVQAAKRRKVVVPPAPKKKVGTDPKDKKTAFRAVLVNGTMGRDHVSGRARCSDHGMENRSNDSSEMQAEVLSLMHDVQAKMKLFNEANDRDSVDSNSRGSGTHRPSTPENVIVQVPDSQVANPELVAYLFSPLRHVDLPTKPRVASSSVEEFPDADRFCSIVSKPLNRVQRFMLESNHTITKSAGGKATNEGKRPDCELVGRSIATQTKNSFPSASASDEADVVQQLADSRKQTSELENSLSRLMEKYATMSENNLQEVNEKNALLKDKMALVKDNERLKAELAEATQDRDLAKGREAQSLADQQTHLTSIFEAEREALDKEHEKERLDCETKISQQVSIHDAEKREITKRHEATFNRLKAEHQKQIHAQRSQLEAEHDNDCKETVRRHAEKNREINKRHEAALNVLKEEHQAQIHAQRSQLEAEHDDGCKETDRRHAEKNREITKRHEAALNVLKEEHQAQIHAQRSQLEAEHDNDCQETDRRHAEKIKGTQKNLTRANLNSKHLRERVRSVKNERDGFRTERDECKDANNKLTRSLNDKTGDLDVSNRDLIRANEEILKLRTSSERAWAEVKLRKSQVESQKINLTFTAKSTASLQCELNSLQTQSKVMESEMNTLKEKLSTIEANNETMRIEQDAAKLDTDQARDGYARAFSRAEELAVTVKSQEERFAKILAEKTLVEAEAKTLRGNVQTLRSDMSSLTELSESRGRELERSRRLLETNQSRTLRMQTQLEATIGERNDMIQAKRTAIRLKVLRTSWSQTVAHGECGPTFFNMISRFLTRHPNRGTAFQYHHGGLQPGLLLHLPRREELLVILWQANHTFSVWQQPTSSCSTFRYNYALGLRMAPGGGRNIVHLRISIDHHRQGREWLLTQLAAQSLPQDELKVLTETWSVFRSVAEVESESTLGKA